VPPEPHAIAVLALLAVAFALFASEKLPVEATSLLVPVLLALGFQLFPDPRVAATDFFLGFGHEARVAICAIVVLIWRSCSAPISATLRRWPTRRTCW